MGWLTLISTLSGGVLGVGSTLVVDTPYDTALRKLRAAMRDSLGPAFDQV